MGLVELRDINPVTEKVIECCYTVSNTLGAGFLERVYENSLALEFESKGIQFQQQAALKVFYQGEIVGDYQEVEWIRKII